MLLGQTRIRHEGVAMSRTVDSAFEVVTVSQLKDHLKLRAANTAEDTKLGELITGARRVIEALTGKVLIQQTWEQLQDAVPPIYELRRSPVASITKIEYIPDWSSDTRQLYSSTLYTLASGNVASRGGSWATHRGFKSWITTFVVGYGTHNANPDDAAKTASRALVPMNLREAVLQLAGHLYENREGEPTEIKYEVMAKNFATIPPNIFTLVHEFMKWRV